MSLITVTRLKQFVKSQTAYDEWLYVDAIAASETYLRTRTTREWVLVDDDTTATERSYRPVCGSNTLWIHDAASITSVVEDGITLTAGTDYIAEPVNNLAADGSWRPTDRLVRYGRAWYSDGPRTTVDVTAKWGWSTLPGGHELPFYVCAKAYLMERDVAFGLVALENGDATGARDAKAVRDFIRDNRGHGSWGIG